MTTAYILFLLIAAYITVRSEQWEHDRDNRKRKITRKEHAHV